MKRYENRVEVIPTVCDYCEVVNALNDLGDEGWRPWHMHHYRSQTWVYLVREYESD